MPRGQACPELTVRGVKVKPPVVERKVLSQTTALLLWEETAKGRRVSLLEGLKIL